MERAPSIPVEERPADPGPFHTADLPPTPQRDRAIEAPAWIEAPAELLALADELGSPPARYLRRIGPWLLWRAGGWDRVVWLWTVQLLLNLAWTPLFFAADLYAVALVEIMLLAASIVVLIAWSWRRSRVAAWLLVPYLAWVCFATALNAGIVVLN